MKKHVNFSEHVSFINIPYEDRKGEWKTGRTINVFLVHKTNTFGHRRSNEDSTRNTFCDNLQSQTCKYFLRS